MHHYLIIKCGPGPALAEAFAREHEERKLLGPSFTEASHSVHYIKEKNDLMALLDGALTNLISSKGSR